MDKAYATKAMRYAKWCASVVKGQDTIASMRLAAKTQGDVWAAKQVAHHRKRLAIMLDNEPPKP